MPDDAAATGADERVLALFDSPGPLATPTPGVRAWLASDPPASDGGVAHPVLIKRVAAGQGKARATQALALRHPNIVPTRRWLIEDGFLYVVRDVVRGHNLRQSLSGASGARPSPELLRRLLVPVLDALEYAHGRGIVHGGLSPENLFVSENGAILITDWATADPKSPPHAAVYGGRATVAGDVRALGAILATYLPNAGAFASLAVRGRIEGVIGRCDTLADLRETLESLEKLAAAPVARITPAAPSPAASAPASRLEPPPILSPETGDGGVPPSHQRAPWVKTPGSPFATDPPPLKAAPELSTRVVDRPRVVQGGGGSVTIVARNEGNAPLVIRMVATQHAWLNVRPMDLPMTIEQGGSARIEFFVSAARLSPGEYRSEVYLSANAGGPTAEDLRAGWFKHTSEVRVTVEDPFSPSPAARPGTASVGADVTELPFPADAPRLPAMPGCAGVLAGLLVILCSVGGILLHFAGL